MGARIVSISIYHSLYRRFDMPVVLEFLRLKLIELWGAIKMLVNLLYVAVAIIVMIASAFAAVVGGLIFLGYCLFTLSYITGIGYEFLAAIWLRDTACPFNSFYSCAAIGSIVPGFLCAAYLVILAGYGFWMLATEGKECCIEFFKGNWDQAKKNVALRTSTTQGGDTCR